MSKLAVTAALPILSLLVLCACTRARGADDYTAFVYAGCSQARYDAGSQYAADVDTVLSSLTNSAGYTAYANYTSPSASTGLVGVYQCRSYLPAAICGCCVRSAVSKLSSLCKSAAGAAVQLRACFVRYGKDSFLGRQDTTVLFKQCGGDGGDAGVVAMRDAALGALVASAAPADEGSYRAGAAGYVQAMSQCVGDLGAKACSDCVSAAASQLKAGCGYASAGEVYLGRCYARFWSNAGTGVSNGGGVIGGGNGISGGGAGAGNGYAYGFVPHTCGDIHDESGKTIAIIMSPIAIIISPVVTIALAIIFRSFVSFVGQAALVIISLFFVERAGGVGGFGFDEQAQDNVGQDSGAVRPIEDIEQGGEFWEETVGPFEEEPLGDDDY